MRNPGWVDGPQRTHFYVAWAGPTCSSPAIFGIRYALVEYGVVKEGVREELLRQWADRLYPEWGSYVTLYLWRRLVAGRQAEGG